MTEDGSHTVTFWSEDKAGNMETAGSPLTFSVDRTAATTKVVNPISPATGWFVTSGIPFAFEAVDAGSGISATYYAIDGSAARTYGEPFTEDLSTGTHTVTYWSEDLAGNAEAKRSFEVSVDTIAPTITGRTSRAANDNGWFNTPVDVQFTCEDKGSGLAGVAGCAGDTTLSNDGEGQWVTGDAVDVAGNRTTTKFGPVKLDQTAPTLVGVPADPNAARWYKGDVVVTRPGPRAPRRRGARRNPPRWYRRAWCLPARKSGARSRR